MKTFCLTTMIAVFLFFCSNGMLAQTTQTKLNQVELMKQFLGTWKCEIAKDTFNIWEQNCLVVEWKPPLRLSPEGRQ